VDLPRLLIVDDFVRARESLRRFVRADFSPIFCDSMTDAVQQIASLEQPLAGAIIDVYLGDGSGFDVARQLRARFGPTFPILVCTARPMSEWIASQLADLQTSFDDKSGTTGVRRFLIALMARSIATPILAGAVVEVATQYSIAPRETGLLAALVNGTPTPALSRELGVSHHTVRGWLLSLRKKLGIQRNTEILPIILRKTRELATGPSVHIDLRTAIAATAEQIPTSSVRSTDDD
jgi:DNA-binding NarL/FixJ family response regulator